jgi:hypothetical protein
MALPGSFKQSPHRTTELALQKPRSKDTVEATLSQEVRWLFFAGKQGGFEEAPLFSKMSARVGIFKEASLTH